MTNLNDRITKALEVLGGDESVKDMTLRQQASAYLGEDVDDQLLNYLRSTAYIIYDNTMTKALAAGYSPPVANQTALANVMIGGMAIGKRLGIEDQEKFAGSIQLP